MDETTGYNRRLEPRRPYHGRVDINAPTFPDLQARARDISEGGIRLMMSREVGLGDRVRFELETTPGQRVRVDAEVRSVTPVAPGRFSVGLQWIRSQASEDYLGSFVDSVTRWVA